MNRQAAEKRGRSAETLACWYLRMHGWRILARRVRVVGGEVDIIARRGRMLAFVEVKARASDAAAAFSLDDGACAELRSRPNCWRRATCVTETTSESTRSSWCRAAGRGMSRTSGKGDKALVRP